MIDAYTRLGSHMNYIYHQCPGISISGIKDHTDAQISNQLVPFYCSLTTESLVTARKFDNHGDDIVIGSNLLGILKAMLWFVVCWVSSKTKTLTKQPKIMPK